MGENGRFRKFWLKLLKNKLYLKLDYLVEVVLVKVVEKQVSVEVEKVVEVPIDAVREKVVSLMTCGPVVLMFDADVAVARVLASILCFVLTTALLSERSLLRKWWKFRLRSFRRK